MTNTTHHPTSTSHISTAVTGPEGEDRASGWLLVIAGLLGLLASLVITLDEFKIYEARAAGRTFTPGCSLNPVISCGSVMESDQAHIFGFPNPLIGLVAFTAVTAIGASLLAGVRRRRWYWLGLQAGTLLGVGFCSWLQFESLYRINALCLWCCLVWTVTIVLFSHVTIRNSKQRVVPVPAGVRRGLAEFPWVLPVVWTGTIGVLILTRWWDFWTA